MGGGDLFAQKIIKHAFKTGVSVHNNQFEFEWAISEP